MAAALERSEQVVLGHAADPVYQRLADEIVGGAWPVGGTLPPERLLGERFGVSRFVVRQALHRLGEIGLVRLRQGGSTTVLDPDRATDLAVLEIKYRQARSSKRFARDLVERQLLQGHAIIHIAARRASQKQLARIEKLVEREADGVGGVAEWRAFEERFWRALADAGGNQLYRFDTNWWYGFLERSPQPRPAESVPRPARAAFLRELARRLVDGEDAAAFYLQGMAPLFALVGGPPSRRRGRRT